MKTILNAVTACLLAASISVATLALAEQPGYELVLIRHAEKVDDSKDPELSPAGQQRAAWTADWLQDRGIAAVWSSGYKRTRNTAAPLAQRLEQDVRIYDPRDLPALAAQLRSDGMNALVVGHSNTTPQLAGLLCECDVRPMDDSEYDRAIVLRSSKSGFEISEIDQKTLRESPQAEN